eukprot:jgi/Ulvmu1/8738/UM047_0079.1
MSVLRRSVQTCLSSTARTRGGGLPWKGGFWSEGSQKKVDGLLFNETPPPPGQSRRWESWEGPYWATFAITAFVGTVTVYAKTGMGVYDWAEEEAMKQLKEEGAI